jgi:hypothetical protein
MIALERLFLRENIGCSMRAERFRNLLDARDDVEVAESAIQAVEIGLGIRGNKDRNNLIDRSQIRRGEVHPQFPFAGGEFHGPRATRNSIERLGQKRKCCRT